jgi:putative thioredoxin
MSSDFSLYGAIDLGARQAAAKRQQERPASAGGNGSVLDVTDETFNAEVADRSRTVPVLVDFWAEWCEPCKQLSPILERLAVEAGGSWLLAKVDIDANPGLASQMQRMGVQGIPFVAAVVAGQMIPLLQGAYPEAQVREGLAQLFAAIAEQNMLPGWSPDGVPADPAADVEAEDPALAMAEAALENEDLDGAEKAFKAMLESDPANPHAKSGLALVALERRADAYNIEQVRKDATDAPNDAAVQAAMADIELLSGRAEEAFDRLIGTVRRTSGEERETARRRLLELFEVLSADDPRIVRARRALAAALF